jgi:transposase
MQIPFSMISALEIKRSLGIVCGKSDKVDARRIAEYAYLHRDTLQVTKMPPKNALFTHEKNN